MRVGASVLVVVCVSVCVCVGVGLADEAAKKEAKKVPTLKDLTWLTGTWRETSGSMVLTEVWNAPQGDAMVGMDHMTVGGKTRMFELLAIEQTEQGLVLNLRHFGKGLRIPDAEKDGPMSWPLKSLEGSKVVFEHPTRAWPKRMEYERQGDVLLGRLSGVENGKPNAIPFRFERQK
ncbi:MAG: DUF6265 family protein [Planctomycetota bacterium]|nr:DUF6265 family protein [Planctomycetota bacterium]